MDWVLGLVGLIVALLMLRLECDERLYGLPVLDRFR